MRSESFHSSRFTFSIVVYMASENESSRIPKLDPHKHSTRDLFLLLGLQLGWFEDTYSNIVSKVCSLLFGIISVLGCTYLCMQFHRVYYCRG